VSLGPQTTWNFGRERLRTAIAASSDFVLHSYWEGDFEFTHQLAAFDDRLTRGGPLARQLAANWLSASVESDPRKMWTVELGLDHAWDAAGGRESSADLSLELRRSAWTLSLGPALSHERSTAQYLDEVPDPTAARTFGHRYVFADLSQTELSLETRMTVAFLPGLTFELYAQPFVSSGAFGAPKELIAPRTFDFRRYGTDGSTIDRDDEGVFTIDPDGTGPAASFEIEDEDFTERSLRGNAVLRWEWRPGSTLYLVWQQQRSGSARFGDFDLRRDTRELFGARPDNVFVVKVSYWIGR
jgi:hypothetical protein